MADLNDYQKRIEASLEDISKITYNAELLAAQESRVQLELRTFSTGGTGVKDVTGKTLSKYSKAYAAKRKKAGLQTENKDLIFDKNTSAIKDNIDVGLSGGKPAMGHVKQEGYLIAGYQEKREGQDIFILNEQEKNNAVNAAKEYLMNAMKELAKSWHP